MLDIRTLQIMTGQSVNLAHAELLQAKYISKDITPISNKELQDRSKELLIIMININNNIGTITNNLKSGSV